MRQKNFNWGFYSGSGSIKKRKLIELKDTPSDYAGQRNRVLVVKEDESGIDFGETTKLIIYAVNPNHNNTYDLDFTKSHYAACKLMQNGITYDANTKEFTVPVDGYYMLEWFSTINTAQSGKKLKIVPGNGMNRFKFFLFYLNAWSYLEQWDLEIPNTNNQWQTHNFIFNMLPFKAGTRFKIEAENAGGRGFPGDIWEWFSLRLVMELK